MTGKFDGAIAELEAQREKIDTAITALRELNGEAKSQEPRAKRLKTSKAAPKPKGFSRKTNSGSTVQELVIGALRSGPKRPGAVLKALKSKASKSSIYTMLSYLKAKGITRVTEDRSHELV